MPNYLDTLITKIDDPGVRDAIRGEVNRLRSNRDFGLVFERHLPETVRLPKHPIRRGVKVQERDSTEAETYAVTQVRQGVASLRNRSGELVEPRAVDTLVVVREFGDVIYPGLEPLRRIAKGGDKPCHAVINAENYHALETLLYAFENKIDAIYLDPPYNTGARDWKYNNDYVDRDDAYRHSKWLSMLERRLRLAVRLLKPDGVMVITVDEHEVSRLGVLLDQVLASALVQMVSIVINPSGVSSGGGLSRVDEYAYFCFFGGAQPVALERDLLTDDQPNADYAGVRWLSLMRGGNAWYRASRPNLCYPILLNEDSHIVGVGEPWPADLDESERPYTIDGLNAAWPVRADGRLGIWRVDRNRIMYLAERGFAHSTGRDDARGTWTVLYLLGGTVDAIEGGELTVTGRGDHNEVLVEGVQRRTTRPKTVWKSSSHTAGGQGGTVMLNNLLGERNRFSYPKSVYAVEDTLMAAVGDRPDAIILDFFAGSGTTAHAVARLNRRDGGRRQSILVTNNEVAETDALRLRAAGHRPGDPEWEAQGVFHFVTAPRIEAAITGMRPDGSPMPSTLRYLDGQPLSIGFEENVEFFTLTYQDRDRVTLGRAFEAIAPLLWMKAGAVGPRIDSISGTGWALPVGGRYGICFDAEQWRTFVNAVHASSCVTNVFVVTDSLAVFQQVVAELPPWVDSTMLYEDYLSTFEINTGAVL